MENLLQVEDYCHNKLPIIHIINYYNEYVCQFNHVPHCTVYIRLWSLWRIYVGMLCYRFLSMLNEWLVNKLWANRPVLVFNVNKFDTVDMWILTKSSKAIETTSGYKLQEEYKVNRQKLKRFTFLAIVRKKSNETIKSHINCFGRFKMLNEILSEFAKIYQFVCTDDIENNIHFELLMQSFNCSLSAI